MTPAELERRLRVAIRGADCRVAADVLHELARQQYLAYAGEVAAAQYKHGFAAANEPAFPLLHGIPEESV